MLFEREFIEKINKFMVEELNSTELLNPHQQIQNNLTLLNDICRKQLIEQYDQNFVVETVEKRSIVLFD